MTSDKRQRTRPRLRPIQEVYNRLLWDEAFDPEEFVIGYRDREAGVVEIELVDFEPGGEIPWHRVVYLRRGWERIWDREARLDRVFGSGFSTEPGER